MSQIRVPFDLNSVAHYPGPELLNSNQPGVKELSLADIAPGHSLSRARRYLSADRTTVALPSRSITVSQNAP